MPEVKISWNGNARAIWPQLVDLRAVAALPVLPPLVCLQEAFPFNLQEALRYKHLEVTQVKFPDSATLKDEV